MSVKFIAFYLPQFHTIPENDAWWGKGFTEWERVKRAKPLFDGHYQPRMPYKYYDLSDTKEMIAQADLAREYNVHGFCYYHYWFNGKLLLERPLENMLLDKRVDIPFCLAWANEPWTRAWEGKNKVLLMPQSYGTEEAWKKHIEYLLPFFKDSRYIYVDNKPIFLIYRTELFERFDEMILFWNKFLKENGIEGIYIAEMLTGYQRYDCCTYTDAVVEFEPMLTSGLTNSGIVKIRNTIIRKLPWMFRKKYRIKEYDRIWQHILTRQRTYGDKAIYLGAFTDWDNTPRFKDRSLIFKNGTSEKFRDYLLLQTQKSKSEYIFINAWNEWAEGAHLEPDLKNGYSYLKAVRDVYNYVN